MMEAAINNRKAIVKMLDSFGADVNLVDDVGMTALHYAHRYGYAALADYMVAKLGADDRVRDSRGRTCHDMSNLSR